LRYRDPNHSQKGTKGRPKALPGTRVPGSDGKTPGIPEKRGEPPSQPAGGTTRTRGAGGGKTGPAFSRAFPPDEPSSLQLREALPEGETGP
ncbi:hypothetical protein ABTC73_20295, partial [Acinetobacter baumannii]